VTDADLTPAGEAVRLPDGLTAQAASKTVVAQALGRGASLLAVLGSTAIITRQIGIDAYADWATVLSLVALVAFALDPGISPIVVRRLSHDPAQAPTAEAIVPLRLGLAAIALVVVIAVTIGLRGGGAALLAVVLGAQVLPRALVLNATPWLQLDQRLHRQTALEAMTAATGLALIAGTAAAGASAELLAVVGFTGPTTILALLMRRELHLAPSRALTVPGPQGPRIRSMLVELAPLAAALLLTATYTRTFVIFLNAAEDTATVARYLFAFQFVEQLIVVAGIVAGATLPLLAVRGRSTALLEDPLTHRLLRAISAGGGLISAALILVADPITRIIGGPDLAPAGRYLELLAPMGAIIMPALVLGYVYVAVGRAGDYLRFNIVALALNLAANAGLTLTIGANASARISWATEAVVVASALGVVARRSPSGRDAGARIAAVVVACVLAAELAAAGVLPAALCAVGLAAAVALFARADLTWLVRESLPRRPAGKLSGSG
jgi:O-antigen/teichoic acid export membrane protein